MIYPRILERFDNFLLKSVDAYVNFRWYASPLTKNIKASKKEYLEIAQNAKNKTHELIDQYEENLGAKIDSDWLHELALHTQVVKKKSDICYVHGRLLYAFLKDYIKTHNLKHINILETGTARGFSALCMAKAMEDSGIEGTIISYDVLPHNHKMYWNCIDDHEGKKTRAELLINYKKLIDRYIIFHQGNTKTELKKIHIPHIHFVFSDAAHDYRSLMTEISVIHNKQNPGDIIFFDDYNDKKYPGVVKAVDEICTKYNYSKTVIKSSGARAYVVAEKK
jgi:predicted O-methyltransferase YrrM